MSLDAQLKARAEAELDTAITAAKKTLSVHAANVGLEVEDFAKLVSGVKVDALRKTTIKARATAIGQSLLGNLDSGKGTE